ncbi:MAG: hypothetical protein IKZ88_08605 [Neisseriaceae bacterium]|nr:hypothetical protein [Neisseriaceae bacterium]
MGWIVPPYKKVRGQQVAHPTPAHYELHTLCTAQFHFSKIAFIISPFYNA